MLFDLSIMSIGDRWFSDGLSGSTKYQVEVSRKVDSQISGLQQSKQDAMKKKRRKHEHIYEPK